MQIPDPWHKVEHHGLIASGAREEEHPIFGATERHRQNAPTTPLAVGLGAHPSEWELPMTTQQPRRTEQC